MTVLGVFGAGVMGGNHVRTARALREWSEVYVGDVDSDDVLDVVAGGAISQGFDVFCANTTRVTSIARMDLFDQGSAREMLGKAAATGREAGRRQLQHLTFSVLLRRVIVRER